MRKVIPSAQPSKSVKVQPEGLPTEKQAQSDTLTKVQPDGLPPGREPLFKVHPQVVQEDDGSAEQLKEETLRSGEQAVQDVDYFNFDDDDDDNEEEEDEDSVDDNHDSDEEDRPADAVLNVLSPFHPDDVRPLHIDDVDFAMDNNTHRI